MLRRIIRRAVRHAYLLGARDLVHAGDGRRRRSTSMGSAYPEIVAPRTRSCAKVVEREEERVPRHAAARRRDARRRSSSDGDVSGDDAFFLHDTLGFPIDLTREIAGERGRDGRRRRLSSAHDAGAARTRPGRAARSRAAARRTRRSSCTASSLEEYGPTEFTGRQEYDDRRRKVRRARASAASASRRPTKATDGRRRARPHAVLRGVGRPGRRHRHDHDGARRRRSTCATRSTACPGNSSCTRRRFAAGTIAEGDEVEARDRRCAPRPHPAQSHRDPHPPLGAARGARLARAAGGIDRRARPAALRLQPPRRGHARTARPQVEQLANEQVITDAPVRHYETTKAEAERIGAIAFFGEKYGEIVRVLEAGTVDRAVRRHARARARVHRPDQDRERGLDRLEPAPHRGGDRRRCARIRRIRRGSCCGAPATLLRATPEGSPRQDRAPLGAGARPARRAQRAEGEGSAGAATELAQQRRGRRRHRAARRSRATTSCASSRRKRCDALGSGVVVLAGAADGERLRSPSR